MLSSAVAASATSPRCPRFPEEIRLVGSRQRVRPRVQRRATRRVIERRRQITEAVQAIGARHGARVEGKPTGVVLHFSASRRR
ncbi:MAG: hypothetical protein R2710_24715 [Acidimicrobiales bacterium]